MGRRSPASLLRHNRRDPAAAAALGAPASAGDGGPTRGADRRAGYRAGPGVVRPPASTAPSSGGAGAPARPGASRVAPDPLTPEAVAQGFVLERIGDRGRLSLDCRNVIHIEEVTRTRVRWYVRTHRCSPVGRPRRPS
jgi:hypothetical protein